MNGLYGMENAGKGICSQVQDLGLLQLSIKICRQPAAVIARAWEDSQIILAELYSLNSRQHLPRLLRLLHGPPMFSSKASSMQYLAPPHCFACFTKVAVVVRLGSILPTLAL